MDQNPPLPPRPVGGLDGKMMRRASPLPSLGLVHCTNASEDPRGAPARLLREIKAPAAIAP